MDDVDKNGIDGVDKDSATKYGTMEQSNRNNSVVYEWWDHSLPISILPALDRAIKTYFEKKL